MRINWRRAQVVASLATVALIVSMSGLFSVTGASAASTTSTTSIFYLDIGGSASVGVQPAASGTHNQRTDKGYANDLVALESTKGITLDLDEVGCSGETTSTMLSGGDKCYLAPDSQLAEAIAFLAAHHDDTGIVTIDLGFNDLSPCIHGLSVGATCLAQKLTLLNQQLPEILTDLRAAAGPETTFIGIGHYNPFLADALRGRDGLVFANQSAVMFRLLNDTLSDIYQTFSIPTANVAKQFALDGNSSVTLPGVGTVTGNVARTCELTWMCPPHGARPNIHPDAAGYRAIAEAIDAVLPPNFDYARGAEPVTP